MGGSETYARSLTSALARFGAHEYLVALPRDAVDASGGLPVVAAGVVEGRPRAAALARATIAGRDLADVDVVHYPLTISVPPKLKPTVVTLHDVLHHDLPGLV